MKRLIFIIILIQFFFVSNAQPWLEKLPQSKTKDTYTFFEYQKAFNEYWKPFKVDKSGYYIENGVKKKASGWKQFNRWEWDVEGQIDPKTGQLPKVSAQEVYEFYLKANPRKQASKAANWSVLGPNASDGGYAGVGRINCIAFHPTDNNTYWIGAPAGGLWETTNNGTTWTCLTDDNDVLGVSDIIVPSDYATSNTIYIATGDRDAWDNSSVGILKSTDAGSTWNSTGISYDIGDGKMVTRLLLDPSDNNTIIAATTNGVYKTINGGTDWSTKLSDESFIDMEYKPGDFTTLYGSTKYGDIYVSNDGGSIWTKTFDDASAKRIELAVTQNNPSVLYALAAGSDNGFYAFYKSITSGATFNEKINKSSINLLGWDANGGDSGGQGWYDLSIAASPTDENTILVGGVNTWRSTNGGSDWDIVSHWSGNGALAVHADKHNLTYRSNGDLFEGNDGGVYISSDNGTGWEDKTKGMVISQMYKLGVSQSVAGEVITGLQDNGTKLISSGTWDDVKGGDGMECLIDYTDVNTQYGTYTNGQISKTTNHWESATNIQPSSAGSGAWVTPYIIDPTDHNTIYAGYADVWKTTNKGDAWTKISSMNSGNKLRSMAIATSNINVLYVADLSNIWKTSNGGTSWVSITNTLPTGSGSITYIAVKDNDENTLWVTLSGYNSDAVYESTDGGSSWANISNGLPELPAYTIAQNKQSTGEVQLYVGTELGVYFKSGTDNWIEFNGGLPNVKIGELEIYYDNTPARSKLYAATYGRGLWQTTVEMPNNDLPSVLTSTPTEITKTTATVGGEILSEGASAIIERGVVWNTTGNPSLSDTKIVEGTVTVDAFTVSVIGLSVATTYYVKAYAINSFGPTYGTALSFTTDCNTPLTQATDFGTTSINDNDVTLTWTSEGDFVLVVAKEGSEVDIDPFTGETYISSSDFTIGEDLGSGNIAVYSGMNQTTTITNLMEGTSYHFAIYKYNDTEKCYNIVSPAIGNATTTGYCSASGGGDEFIDGVSIGSISTSGTGSNSYEDYTSLSTDLGLGGTYALSITNGSSYDSDDLGVWIDFNDNGSFEDGNENVICTSNDGATGDYNLTIPSDVVLGSHRMRIRIKYDGSDCGSPCGTTEYGEVEDYSVNLICVNIIATDPVSISVCDSDEAEFTVEATGVGLSYQWKKGTTDVGTNSATLTIGAVSTDDAGDYTCEVSGICGDPVTSDIATLTVNIPTVITQQPTNQSLSTGEAMTLNVVAEGTSLTYQWRFNSSNINGATDANYQIQSVITSNVGDYDVVVSGECGDVTSDIATLSVATSIEKLSDFGINIYPNPSEGIFNISYSKNIGDVKVTIVSYDGKLIYDEIHNSDSNKIDISDRPSGSYLIRFNFKDKTLVSRIILL